MSPRPRRPAPRVATCLALAVAACTSGPPATPPTTSTSLAPSTSAAPPSPSTTATAGDTTISLDEVARHPAGVTVRVEALTLASDGITLDVAVTNGATEEAVLAAEPSWVSMVDDTGTDLAFEPPDGNARLAVAAGDELTGTLAFSGTPSPDATGVDVRFNWVDGDPWNDDEQVAGIVSFAFDGLPLPGAATDAPTDATAPATPAPRQVDVDVRQEHPGGVILEITQVATAGDGVLLTVRVVNTDTNESTALAVQPELTWLEDDLGSRYPLRPPDDNPQLAVDPGDELVGQVAFVGPLDPDASHLTLVTNHRGGDPINLDQPAPGSASFVVPDLPVP